LALALAALATIGCDRVTKRAAMELLAAEPGYSNRADTVRLSYTENAGGTAAVIETTESSRRVFRPSGGPAGHR
jgi:hypothetical protein